MPSILIISDKQDIFTELSNLLKVSNPDVTYISARSGEEGIKKALILTPDTIILDAQIPETNQGAICRMLTSDDVTRHIPVLIISDANNNRNHRATLIENGADAFLNKPIDPLELAAQVKAMLRIKKAEDILRSESLLLEKMETKYRLLFNEMLDGCAIHKMIYDENGQPVNYRFLDVNPAFERITGLKGKDILNRTVLEVIPDIETYWIETYGRVVLTGKPAYFHNYSKGLDKYFEVTAFRNAPDQFACIFVDMTGKKKTEEEKKKLEALLRQSQKMEAIGTLSGGIAHDFNNILFPIIGFTEMMIEKMSEDNEIREDLEEVLKAALRAKKLVKQILEFSRQAEKEVKPIKLQYTIKEIVSMMRASIPSTIDIDQQIDNSCGLIIANPTHINQILVNLITNAYHAMEETGGKLTIKISEEQIAYEDISFINLGPGKYARLSVSDTGTGIEKSNLEKIFDPYFTTKDENKGTGLGLSVVHGIVKSYKGDIRVYSEPGKGTEFAVYLPIMESTYDKQGADTPLRPAPGGTEHILLVDDELPILKMAKRMLEGLGYQVTCRSSSTEALEAFRFSPDNFDMVITDLIMPNMTGDKLAHELQQIRKETPILLCSGFSEKISEKDAKALGISGCVLKPIIKNALAQKIREILDNK